MSGKSFFGGVIVVALIAGLVTNEAMGFRGGRGGRVSGTRRAPSAARSLPSMPSASGIGSAISSPSRSGVPTLAPQQPNSTRPNRSQPTFNRPSEQPLRNQLNASQPSDVLDHLGVERPTGTSRPYASEIGNWSPSSYQPFTPAWYAQHPNAWQITHPNADVAAVATATAVATWLGLSHAYTGSSTTTIVEDTSISDPSTTTPETAPEITEDTAVTIDNGEWMPLGSFELKLDGQSVATRAVHLAVNRQGLIRGNYYDMAADSVKEVTGKVDKQTLQTSWTIGEDGLVVYEISVPALSSPDGQLTVRYANGRTATWRTSPIQP